jgi:RNA recognition motif-containing protein
MGTRLFISNLSQRTVESDLRGAFAAQGLELGDVDLVKDPETGRPRGFAFADLTGGGTAEQAVERLARYDLQGRSINIRVAMALPSAHRRTALSPSTLEAPPAEAAAPNESTPPHAAGTTAREPSVAPRPPSPAAAAIR